MSSDLKWPMFLWHVITVFHILSFGMHSWWHILLLAFEDSFHRRPSSMMNPEAHALACFFPQMLSPVSRPSKCDAIGLKNTSPLNWSTRS